MRSQRVIINDSFSDCLPAYVWSASGNWASVVFILYIDDIHQSISHSSVLLFADDIALYKEVISMSDQDTLQADLSPVFEWSHKMATKLRRVFSVGLPDEFV